jgi:ElaB/YqjD/DUF883 family membrane-anchored ribosome-binding protein
MTFEMRREARSTLRGSRILACVLLPLAVGCTEAEQTEFMDAAEQMGEQVSRSMDRLGERMDAVLGDTDSEFGALAEELGRIELPELRGELQPQLEATRERLSRVRREVEGGAELSATQRERLQEIDAEVQRLVVEAREALRGSEDDLREAGRHLGAALETLEARLAEIQEGVEGGGND